MTTDRTPPGAPDWLAQALQAAPTPARSLPDHRMPAAGDIRLLNSMDRPGPPSRLVAVRSVDHRDGTASVALLSPETALAGPQDRLLPSAGTGLAYDLLLEDDVQAPVWLLQLGPAVGAAHDPSEIGAAPLRDELDARWTWKEEELDALGALADDCIRQLAAGPPTTVVDPLCLDLSAGETVLAHVAVHVAESPPGERPLIPAWTMLPGPDGAPAFGRWRDAAQYYTLRVLQDAALTGCAAYMARPPRPDHAWIAGRELGRDDPLAAVLADLVKDGARCVRVMTASAMWNVDAKGLRVGDPVAAEVGGVRCQILWHAVDAPGAHHA